ncbi:DNase I-like protein, partial [Trametes versicolor FP-101664 SS1]|uniref:DNase I-like protein n=1 Tax=Trametes versicolor (strain FP-101664) TaxID=717944 RepID=UPI00046219CD
MRDEKIAILALQETHLDDSRAASLNELFGRYMWIYHSPLESNPTGACGVAFVVNKRFVDIEKCAASVIQGGRAIALEFPWAGETVLRALNVYGPNSSADNALFWDELATSRTGRVDILLGDFNMVEDGIDRIPARAEAGRVCEALAAFLRMHRLEDGWRVRNPHTKAFSYMQGSTGAQSRLDRIYLPRKLQADAEDWSYKESGLVTDHKLAMTSLANRAAPFMGKGRWSMPAHLLTDQEMKKTMRALGEKLISGIADQRPRTSARNPQTLYKEFKDALTCAARNRAKAKVPKLQRRLGRLRLDLEVTLNPPGED